MLQLHQPEFCSQFSAQSAVTCMEFPNFLYQHAVLVNCEVLWICSWNVLSIPSTTGLQGDLWLSERFIFFTDFFQKRELIILLLGKIFTIWKLPPKLKRFIFTIRFCFFSLQLKDVSISFWGRIIIICKIENFPYKFSLLKGGWFSFIPVV